MRIDAEYIKLLLDVFLNSPKPTADLKDFPMLDLKGDVNDDVHKFVFHMEILEDQGFIEPAINTSSIGIKRISHTYSWSVIPLRLTASGHDFASALSKPGIIEELRSKFKDAGPGETVKAVFGLATKAFDRKLRDLTED